MEEDTAKPGPQFLELALESTECPERVKRRIDSS